jgi:hypothetical protein
MTPMRRPDPDGVVSGHAISRSGRYRRFPDYGSRRTRSSAVQNLLGGDQAMAASRRPALYADAAYAVVTRPSREYTGHAFPCEDVLVGCRRASRIPSKAAAKNCSRHSNKVL